MKRVVYKYWIKLILCTERFFDVVIAVKSDSIFKNIVGDDKVYDFSMCNPPFFENEGDGDRVVKVLPPRNAPSGNDGELKTEGGEMMFVTRMIEESVKLRDRIKIYSTMIGKKTDLLCLKKLIKSSNIENSTWTEFCQGHTTRYLLNYMLNYHVDNKSPIWAIKIVCRCRWGLAWSFLPKNIVDLSTAPVIRKSGKSTMPFKDDKTLITFPMKDKFSRMDDVIGFLNETAKELNVLSCIFCLLHVRYLNRL